MTRSNVAVWNWLIGLAFILLATSAVLISYRDIPVVNPCSDCGKIYYSILRQHRDDDHWLRTHVLLKTATGSRFIKSDVTRIISGLSWFERLTYAHQFRSFLAQNDGEPLPYFGAEIPRLRLISPSDRRATFKQGISVLSFTLPGFSLDHRRAVVFLSIEDQSSPEIAPSFSGSLMYLKRIDGDWITDHPHGLPTINLIS